MAKSKKIEETTMPLLDIQNASKIEGVSEEAINDLITFRSTIENQTNKCQNNYFYDMHQDWLEPMYAYTHDALRKYGFDNGKPEKNTTPDVQFWYFIYTSMHDICFSQFLNCNSSRHHASAYERNEALKKEIDWLINAMKK